MILKKAVRTAGLNLITRINLKSKLPKLLTTQAAASRGGGEPCDRGPALTFMFRVVAGAAGSARREATVRGATFGQGLQVRLDGFHPAFVIR